MLPHGIRGKTMKLRRVADDGTVTEFDIQAQDLGVEHGITFSVDADVEDGDEVTDTLPNGKTRTMRLHEVEVRQNPLPGATSALDHTRAKYTLAKAKTILHQPPRITLPDLHPLISDASGSQMATKHFDDAVFNACKAVEDRVQALAGHPKNQKGEVLGGKGLMGKVFDEQAPLLDITSGNASEAQKANEREGFKYLFMGVAQGLRNPRGHGPKLQTTEQMATEMLAMASLLMRALDRAETRKAASTQGQIGSGLHSGASGAQI